MLLALLAAGAAHTLDPAMVRPGPTPSPCNPALARTATLTRAEARKLGRLPPAALQLTVLKTVEGCGVTVLPTRDANGHYVMIFEGDRMRFRPANTPRSAPEGGRQRDR